MSEQTSTENVEQSTERPQRKVRRGYVVSDKMDKTVVVLVEERYKHSLYGKVLRRSKKVKVHDENNEAGVGDLVSIMETRPAGCFGTSVQETREKPVSKGTGPGRHLRFRAMWRLD